MNSQGFGEIARMNRLAWTFVVGLCEKYPFRIGKLKYSEICCYDVIQSSLFALQGAY